MFESSVNSEGIETSMMKNMNQMRFESSVNSEGIETKLTQISLYNWFESSVNSEGIETAKLLCTHHAGLRAV